MEFLKRTNSVYENSRISFGDTPYWWLVTMFILSLAYLIPEAVFNASLIDAAGGRDSTEDDLRTIELFGRAISGIGVTLLFIDRYFQRDRVRAPLSMFIISILVLTVIWPLVFFGQKLAVDKLLIDPSTPAERQQAVISQLLKLALTEDSVKITGLDYRQKREHGADEKTFLSIFGGLVYAHEGITHDLEGRKEAIVKRFVEDRANRRLDENYERYRNFRGDLEEAYETYLEKSDDYNKIVEGWQNHANAGWGDLENEISQGWNRYQKHGKAFNTRIEARAVEVKDKIITYFRKKKKCYENRLSETYQERCLKTMDGHYRRNLQRYGLDYFPDDDWLSRESISLFKIKLLSADIVSHDVRHYVSVLKEKMEPKFVKESGGYPLDIQSLNEFRAHDVTRNKIVKKMKSNGINLPSSWKITDVSGYNMAVKNSVKEKADTNWKAETRKKGMQIAPNLDWNQFQLSAYVQNDIREEMGEDLYVSPMLAIWNNSQFLNKVVKPNVDKKTQYYLKVIESSKIDFEDGGAFEELGRASLRSTLVPPISMSISLILIILTMLKLPKMFWRIVNYHRGIQLLPEMNIVQFVGLKVGVVVLSLVLVFTVPFLTSNSRYTENGNTVDYLLAKVGDYSESLSFILRWAMSAQPIIYPMGDFFNEHLRIVNKFGEVEEELHKFDQGVLGDILAESDVSLTVTSSAPDFQVRIMDIKQKYRKGIILSPGIYDIEVSAPGYKTVRRFMNVNRKNRNIKVDLEEL